MLSLGFGFGGISVYSTLFLFQCTIFEQSFMPNYHSVPNTLPNTCPCNCIINFIITFFYIYRLCTFLWKRSVLTPGKNGDTWLVNYTNIPVSVIHFIRLTISSASLSLNLQNSSQHLWLFYQSFSLSIGF